jgi:hypothetical protein
MMFRPNLSRRHALLPKPRRKRVPTPVGTDA